MLGMGAKQMPSAPSETPFILIWGKTEWKEITDKLKTKEKRCHGGGWGELDF